MVVFLGLAYLAQNDSFQDFLEARGVKNTIREPVQSKSPV